jgi:xylulokinase
MADKIIAYDLGTGGVKASLYDLQGNCLASAFVSYETLYPDTGWHEQRPKDWWNAIVESTRTLMANKLAVPSDIECLAISGQSLTVVPVDKEGILLREAVPIWSDRRTVRQTAAFFSKVDRDQWYMTTGNGFPAECYSIFKVMWYRDNESATFARTRAILGSKDWVNLQLTGRMFTDFSYASGSGIYELRGWKYSEDFLRASGVSNSLFPEIVPSTTIIGTLTARAAESLGLTRRVKVACGGVDNSCMALGARNIGEGRVYTSLGSSSWIAVSSRQPVLDVEVKPYVFTHVIPEFFTSAVSIFAAGSCLRWLRDTIFEANSAVLQGRDPYEAMSELAAASPIGANKLIFNPSLAGGGMQEPSTHMRGGFLGLDLRHTRGDLIRACMEGIAMNLGAVLEVLRKMVPLAPEMLMVGGGSKSRFWRQIFADVYRMDCVKTNIDQEAGALGAAAVAAVGAGFWDGFAKIDEVLKVDSVQKPIPDNVESYFKIMPAFEMARKHQAEFGELLHGIEI